ncbi:hypothetical protein E4U19_002761 [Claviceps sp. Clav32 group G5]|nr:hypothetical protein E4U19_002761 [Claviceps sp. Clav32 group G5]
MSRSRLMAVAVAGSALIGGTFYATRRPEKQSPEELRRNKADRARDLGLGSAGMGHNLVTGGPEAGAAPSRPDETDRMRPVHTTASSKDKLPSGGAGGGEGAGRTSARATELPAGKKEVMFEFESAIVIFGISDKFGKCSETKHRERGGPRRRNIKILQEDRYSLDSYGSGGSVQKKIPYIKLDEGQYV